MRRRPDRTAQAAEYAAYYSDDGAGSSFLGNVADDPNARCGLCGKGCTARDYCCGCSSWICAGCDNPDADQRPQGTKHLPEAHRVRAKALP